MESRGNQLSVSVGVTVTLEKIIQLSGDEDLLEFESVDEYFLFSTFLFKSKETKLKENTIKQQTSSCYSQPIAFTKQ